MKFEIKSEYGHYVLYVNGEFYGSYDTFADAAKDVDDIMASREVVA